MNNRTFLSSNDTKYKNARASLLMIVLLSTLNLLTVTIGDTYFLFSAHIPTVLAATGAALAQEAGNNLLLIIMVVLAAILIVPYLVCWIFSKKHVGWMIGALVLFGVDSLFFLLDFVSLLADGEFTMFIDLVFRIWAIGSLIAGVNYGLKAKKEKGAAENGENVDAMFPQQEEIADDFPRQITVTRKKAFSGCAVAIVVFADGKEICQLKNGESKTISVPSRTFKLGGMFASGLASGDLTVPAESSCTSYQFAVKSGFTTAHIEITPMSTTNV